MGAVATMTTIYDITISNSSFTGNTSPNDGFIDPVSSYAYMDGDDDEEPTTLANAIAKARANRRFKNVIMRLTSLTTNIFEVDRTLTGGDANTPHSSITFRFQINNTGALRTPDENNVGQWLVGALALKRVVARALLINETYNMEVYDPTDVTIVSNGADVTIPRGIILSTYEVGPVAANLAAAEGAITVTAIN